MPTITVEIAPPLAGPFRRDGGDQPVAWQEEVARGETLARLLARLVNERSAFGRLYDPATRRLSDRVEIAINGRRFNLVGGLTYSLHDTDTVTLRPDETGNPAPH